MLQQEPNCVRRLVVSLVLFPELPPALLFLLKAGQWDTGEIGGHLAKRLDTI